MAGIGLTVSITRGGLLKPLGGAPICLNFRHSLLSVVSRYFLFSVVSW